MDQIDLLPAVVESHASLPAEIAELAERAGDYARASKSPNTRRAYDKDWRHFADWCRARGIEPMPADPIGVVLAYLTAHASVHKVNTLQRRLVAIRECHRYAGFDLDTTSVQFRDVWRGIRREEGRARPITKKAPLNTPTLRRAIRSLPDNLIGCRDRALLLIGFAAGLRRAELATLEVTPRAGAPGWIEVMPEGLAIRLAYSKTDQEAIGDTVGVPYGAAADFCPVRAYQAWLKMSEITDGPVFRPVTRHGKLVDVGLKPAAIAIIVKRAIVTAAIAEGHSQEEGEGMAEAFSGHSLRAGHATSAAQNDAPAHAIQRQLRHKSFNTTAGYIREGRLFKGSSASFALR
jgi:site-specific recombinase XerD